MMPDRTFAIIMAVWLLALVCCSYLSYGGGWRHGYVLGHNRGQTEVVNWYGAPCDCRGARE